MALSSQSEIFRPAIMRQGRVLIVDDEESVRMPIRRNLLQAGLEVIETADGEEAIAALTEGDNALMVDVILCDIRMPKVDGTDLIPYLRTQYPSIPVIVLTGYPDVELAIKLMKAGVRDYLVKPASKQDLLKVLKNAVDHHLIFKDQFAV
jgi:two-component system chemotaxis response regulator CheY